MKAQTKSQVVAEIQKVRVVDVYLYPGNVCDCQRLTAYAAT